MRVLLVEDDPILGDGTAAALRDGGYSVDWVTDGDTADAALSAEAYELVVLDIRLPRQSGLDVLKKLRARGSDTSVLILTARDSVADRVSGLDSGADDYLVKPFDLDELAARLRAIHRRRFGRPDPTLRHGSIVLDPAAHVVLNDGEEVQLTKSEFALLQLLLENTGRVLSRDKMISVLYGWDEEIESNAVEVRIHHLRKKIGSDLIRTIRGVGYTIDLPR